MEGLAPSLVLIREVRSGIALGDAIIKILRSLTERASCPLRSELVELLLSFDKGERPKYQNSLSAERCALLDLLYAGLEGAPISTSMAALEKEIILSCERQIEEHVALLPIQLLFPLMFFMLPALLILILGPVLFEIIEGVK